MKVDMYVSARKPLKILTVPSGTDLHCLAGVADPDLAEVVSFPGEHELARGGQYIGVDAEDVLDQIEQRGFAVHTAKVTIKVGN